MPEPKAGAVTEPSAPRGLDCRGRFLRCGRGPHGAAVVMGILNITPDSFFDGGRYMRLSDALHRAEEMIDEGATIIDIGGESSRPGGKTYGEGAQPITDEEEISRVVPVIEAVVEQFPETFVSIDTYKPAVARTALEAGAHIVNDISGLRYDPETARVAAEAGAPLVVMHSVGMPGALAHEVEHDDVVEAVYRSLAASVEEARRAGVCDVVVDPGFGFGKSTRDNLRLLKYLDRFADLAGPVLVGISRKSTIGRVLERDGVIADVHERLSGSLGATAVALMHGASIVRTHDVRPTIDLLRVVKAIVDA